MINKTVELLFTQCSCGKCCKTSQTLPGCYYMDIAAMKNLSPNKHKSAKLQTHTKYRTN